MHRPTLAELLRAHGEHYRGEHRLSVAQAKAWRAIVDCRTEALGGTFERCDACGQTRHLWRSCRNRHCPQCQSRAKEAWRAARLAELLPVPYAHWVFTLPHVLNSLATWHARWVYDQLFACAAATLTDLAANPRWLGATPAFSLVLHTWTQDLRTHIHVHALVTCGGVDADGNWKAAARGPGFLFPVRAASRIFRAKFLAALECGRSRGDLPNDPERAANHWQRRRRALLAHEWVVYAKTPAAGPAQVLDYLARYTHRTAISNERILGCDAGVVRLRVRGNERGGKRAVRLPVEQFIGRFLAHVLPSGFKRIRHYGLLAPSHKRGQLAAARRALDTPNPDPVANEQARDFLQRVTGRDPSRCPHCGHGHWVVVCLVGRKRERDDPPQPRCRHGPL